MLRKRFDQIRVIDFRGDTQGTRPATVEHDENIFNIEVGVCVLIATAAGEERIEGAEAEVSYADVWREGAFTRREKLDMATAAAADVSRLTYQAIQGRGMDRLKPFGFAGTDWPSVEELFTFRSNGIVTYRDSFAYATSFGKLSERIRNWLRLPNEEAKLLFGESAMNKVGPALKIAFNENAIERVSYRPFDLRYLYNQSQYVDRSRPELQAAWGDGNVALIALEDGTGAGPAVWCHGLKPDQHSFRGSYGGWVMPLWNHAAEGIGHFLNPGLVPGISAAYGTDVEPQRIFDAILALLSASTYTTRYAHDLEDDFAHVPFPADPEQFEEAARIGARLRALQSFAKTPRREFQRARLVGRASGLELEVPTPQRAFIGGNEPGHVALRADQSFRLSGVSERAWNFSVSGYRVFYRWLRARNGETITADLQREILDTIARIDESLHLFDQADILLAGAIEASLTRAQLGLPANGEGVAVGAKGNLAPD